MSPPSLLSVSLSKGPVTGAAASCILPFPDSWAYPGFVSDLHCTGGAEVAVSMSVFKGGAQGHSSSAEGRTRDRGGAAPDI